MSVSDINFTTTKIKMLNTGKECGSASGFFFRHKGVKYLATNRHVVVDEKNNFYPDTLIITLHLSKTELFKNSDVQVDLYESDTPLWIQHPSYNNNHCDVVLLRLDSTTLKGINLSLFNSSSITFMDSEIINKRTVNPFGNVVVVGYPLGFHDELHNLPVYRKASIASAYGVDFNGLPYFLIDTNLHPGTSGSPVVNSHHTLFKENNREEGYVLFGIHSAEHVINGNSLGLNVVWYGKVLEEIAES